MTSQQQARVVAFVPATLRDPAIVKVACPYGCPERTPTGRVKRGGGAGQHLHGVGNLGADHRSYLTERSAHCPGRSGSYVLTDPASLVPAARRKAVAS